MQLKTVSCLTKEELEDFININTHFLTWQRAWACLKNVVKTYSLYVQIIWRGSVFLRNEENSNDIWLYDMYSTSSYLTIIHLRLSEYCRIIPETSII